MACEASSKFVGPYAFIRTMTKHKIIISGCLPCWSGFVSLLHVYHSKWLCVRLWWRRVSQFCWNGLIKEDLALLRHHSVSNYSKSCHRCLRSCCEWGCLVCCSTWVVVLFWSSRICTIHQGSKKTAHSVFGTRFIISEQVGYQHHCISEAQLTRECAFTYQWQSSNTILCTRKNSSNSTSKQVNLCSSTIEPNFVVMANLADVNSKPLHLYPLHLFHLHSICTSAHLCTCLHICTCSTCICSASAFLFLSSSLHLCTCSTYTSCTSRTSCSTSSSTSCTWSAHDLHIFTSSTLHILCIIFISSHPHLHAHTHEYLLPAY